MLQNPSGNQEQREAKKHTNTHTHTKKRSPHPHQKKKRREGNKKKKPERDPAPGKQKKARGDPHPTKGDPPPTKKKRAKDRHVQGSPAHRLLCQFLLPVGCPRSLPGPARPLYQGDRYLPAILGLASSSGFSSAAAARRRSDGQRSGDLAWSGGGEVFVSFSYLS